MILRNLNIDGNGIFYYINKNVPFEFLEPETIRYLDILFMGKHGERKTSPLVDTIFLDGVLDNYMDNLGFVLGMMFKLKWVNSHKLLNTEIPMESYSLTTVEKVSADNVNDSISSSERTNISGKKISAYDDDILVDDFETDNVDSDTNTSNKTNTNVRDKTSTISGNRGFVVDDRNKNIDFYKSNVMYDIIINDVASELATLIY